MTALYIIVVASSYLLGSIPFGYLLVKMFLGEDIRLSGSGNIGATNVHRSGAKGLGLATLVLDMLKGLLAVSLALRLGNSTYNYCIASSPCVPVARLMALATLAAVLGHMFPAWLRFKGGKGVATAVGAWILLFPKALLISIVLFIVVVALTRYVSLGSIVAAGCLPFAAWFVERVHWQSVALVSALSLLVIVKHYQNIRRLLSGNEGRFGGKKSSIAEKQV